MRPPEAGRQRVRLAPWPLGSWCISHGRRPWREMGRAPWAETPGRTWPQASSLIRCIPARSRSLGGVRTSSWLCFKRDPVETAKEQRIHVKPRNTSKTISQPFREIYSGLRFSSGRGGVPQLNHITFRPQWAQSYDSFPTGFRTSLSQVSVREERQPLAISVPSTALLNSCPTWIWVARILQAHQSLWGEDIRPPLGPSVYEKRKVMGTHTASILSFPWHECHLCKMCIWNLMKQNSKQIF